MPQASTIGIFLVEVALLTDDQQLWLKSRIVNSDGQSNGRQPIELIGHPSPPTSLSTTLHTLPPPCISPPHNFGMYLPPVARRIMRPLHLYFRAPYTML